MTNITTAPFPGLRPFEQAETHLFYGREKQIVQLVRRLQDTRFLAIVGASGCGKSSLIRAGLLPSLQGDPNSPLMRNGSPSQHAGQVIDSSIEWRLAIMRPGNEPTKALALSLSEAGVIDDHWKADKREMYTGIVETTLRSSSKGLEKTIRESRLPNNAKVLILVDQFEEIFRFRNHKGQSSVKDEAKGFVQLLLNTIESSDVSVYVVLTMRSEYLGYCMSFPGLPEAISESQYLVPKMSRNELLTCITGPPLYFNEKLAPRLASFLLNELGEDQDQLPLLQHYLMRLWKKWMDEREDHSPLDFQHINQDESIHDALGNHADQVYNRLKKKGLHQTVRKVFQILTEANSEGLGIRRPVTLEQLLECTKEQKSDVTEVLECYRAPGCCFLMPSTETDLSENTIIDISHESLMRTWGRLEKWISEEENSARYYNRYLDVAQGWENTETPERKKAYLWSDRQDDRLEFAITWLERFKPNTAWAALYTHNQDIDIAAKNLELIKSFIFESKVDRERQEAEVAEARQREHVREKRKRNMVIGLTLVAAIIVIMALTHERTQQLKIANHQKLFTISKISDPLLKSLFLFEYMKDNDFDNLHDITQHLLRQLSTVLIPVDTYVIPDSSDFVEQITTNRNGSTIAIGTAAGKVYTWDWQTSIEPTIKNEVQGRGGVVGLSFGKEDKLIAAYSGSYAQNGTFESSILSFSSNGKTEAGVELAVENYPIYSMTVDQFSGTLAYSLFVFPEETGKVSGRVNFLSTSTDTTKSIGFDSPIFDIVSSQRGLITGSLDGTISWFGGQEYIVEDNSVTLPARNSGSANISSLALDEESSLAIGSEDGFIYLLALENYTGNSCISDTAIMDRCWFATPGYNCIALKPNKNYGDVTGVGFWEGRVFGGYEDGTIKMWQCDSSQKEYKHIMTLRGHQGAVVDVKLAQDENLLISADKKEVRIWDLNQLSPKGVEAFQVGINDIAVNKNKGIIVAGESGSLFVGQAGMPWREVDLKKSPVISVDANIKGEIMAAFQDGSAALLNTQFEVKKEVKLPAQNIIDVTYGSYGDIGFIGSGRNLFKWLPGEEPGIFYQSPETDGKITATLLNPDGTMLVACFENGAVKVWKNLNGSKPLTVGNHDGDFSVREVSFLGKDHVVTAGSDGNFCVWNTNTENQQCRSIFPASGNAVSVDGASVDGDDMVAGGSSDGVIWWLPSYPDEEPVRVGMIEGSHPIVRFSSDRKHIITSADDGSIQLWPLTSKEKLHRLREATRACLTQMQREKYLHEGKEEAKNNETLCKSRKLKDS